MPGLPANDRTVPPDFFTSVPPELRLSTQRARAHGVVTYCLFLSATRTPGVPRHE
jgi:hypothetical protein